MLLWTTNACVDNCELPLRCETCYWDYGTYTVPRIQAVEDLVAPVAWQHCFDSLSAVVIHCFLLYTLTPVAFGVLDSFTDVGLDFVPNYSLAVAAHTHTFSLASQSRSL
jgi:hypothetical protein